MLRHLYSINAALLATHEVDSAYWKEWNIFHLPGGIPGFLLLHIALFLLVFWGFEQVVQGRRSGLWASMILAGAGVFALAIHGTMLLAGGSEFRVPVSIFILLSTGVVSVLQLVAAGRAMRSA
jgi:hypothetical protein